MKPRIVACSGGVDSLLLATVAHRSDPGCTVVAHSISPAVPGRATGRVASYAANEGWQLNLVATTEFEDESYLSNPKERCYHCKTHLYDALENLTCFLAERSNWYILSGANKDDLSEYRPGLIAASEHGVRHPFVECDLGKADIREVARLLGLDCADLPASPCLASRLHTGTRVTEARLRSADAGEELIRRLAGIAIVRCRFRQEAVVVEVPIADQAVITPQVLGRVIEAMRMIDPTIVSIRLDDQPYGAGRAIDLTAAT
jgi:uncharacterized protein